jgi:hypothetical protein
MVMCSPEILKRRQFDAEGDGYDYRTARRYGMRRHISDDPKVHGHMDTRTELGAFDLARKGLPEGTGIMLKGAQHDTWAEALQGEEAAGFDVVKKGDRYYSIPKGQR